LPPLPFTNERVEPAGENLWKYVEPGSGFWRTIKYQPESDYHSEIDSEILRGGFPALRKYVDWVERHPPLGSPDSVAGLKMILEPVQEKFFILGQADILLPSDASWLPLFLEAMALEPDLVDRYFRATTDTMLLLIDAQAEAGVHGFIGGTDLAHHSSTLISPAMFRRFIFPSLRRITERCHARGLPYFKHTDGNVQVIEEEFLLGCGFDGYHAIEPSAGMDIRRLKRQYGNRLTLLGNIDCGELLTNGTEREIAAAVRECIVNVAPGGGYILSSSNSIHSGVPTKNFLAMLQAARKYGMYPISGS
jgi:uroporphyrinogen decarboxylase